jgi:hypothetical protein
LNWSEETNCLLNDLNEMKCTFNTSKLSWRKYWASFPVVFVFSVVPLMYLFRHVKCHVSINIFVCIFSTMTTEFSRYVKQRTRGCLGWSCRDRLRQRMVRALCFNNFTRIGFMYCQVLHL